MTQPLSELLTVDNLRRWAEAKQPGDIVGTANKSMRCPVSTYLREQGYEYSRVDCYGVLAGTPDDDVFIATPQDISFVVWLVDRDRVNPDTGEISWGNPVTASEFLTILNSEVWPA